MSDQRHFLPATSGRRSGSEKGSSIFPPTRCIDFRPVYNMTWLARGMHVTSPWCEILTLTFQRHHILGDPKNWHLKFQTSINPKFCSRMTCCIYHWKGLSTLYKFTLNAIKYYVKYCSSDALIKFMLSTSLQRFSNGQWYVPFPILIISHSCWKFTDQKVGPRVAIVMNLNFSKLNKIRSFGIGSFLR